MKINNPFGIGEKSFSLILQELARFPDIERAVIFGSRALGNYRRGSDIDIAVYGKKLLRQTVDDLSVKLNEELPIPYFVDVAAPKYLSNEHLKEHIEKVGVVFYEQTARAGTEIKKTIEE